MKLMLDAHEDLLHQTARLNIQDFNLNKNRPELQVDIPKLRISGVNALFFALFVKQGLGVEEGRKRIELLHDIFFNILGKDKSKLLYQSSSPKQLLEDVKGSKISITLGLENGMVIGNDLNYLKYYWKLGVRYITLCHNFSNQICDSSTDKPIHNGLSSFGKKVIKQMNKIGLMIDISHASDKSAEDVLDISELPVIASHSNSRFIYDNPRNLNNSLLTKIAENGGVVQISVLPKCIGSSGVLKPIYRLVNHIDYIKRLIGINHIGFGSDFDGGGGIKGCEDIGEVGNITYELEELNYSKEDLDKFWGGNFMKVYQRNYNN